LVDCVELSIPITTCTFSSSNDPGDPRPFPFRPPDTNLFIAMTNSPHRLEPLEPTS
jgi:hypothetical protein